LTAASALAGVVLAGGASSRFGRDKADEVWRGRPLLDWSIAALDPLCHKVFVSGRDHPEFASVADRPRAGLGPLGGLAGALTAARDRGYGRLLSLPCDTPHVPSDLLAHLAASRSAVFVAACPVIGLWPTADADRLAAWLVKSGAGSMRAWTAVIGAEPVEIDHPIANINRPDDLAALGGYRLTDRKLPSTSVSASAPSSPESVPSAGGTMISSGAPAK